MEVSNPRDDRAERNRGSAEVPLSTVIPRVGNFHLELWSLGSAQHGHPLGWKLPSRTEHHIRFFFLHNNPQNLVYFKVFFFFFFFFFAWVRTPGWDVILSPRQKVWQFLSGVQEIQIPHKPVCTVTEED